MNCDNALINQPPRGWSTIGLGPGYTAYDVLEQAIYMKKLELNKMSEKTKINAKYEYIILDDGWMQP
jgi:hypothetical protein